jgi:hypothetical protein
MTRDEAIAIVTKATPYRPAGWPRQTPSNLSLRITFAAPRDRDVGKSTLAIAEGLAMATARDLLGAAQRALSQP